MQKIIINVAIFYAAWLGIIVSQSLGYYQVCHLVTPILFAAHLIFVARSPKIEFIVLPLIAILGYSCDAVMAASGLMRFTLDTQPAPLWLLELWLVFATTINYSMKAILQRPLMAAFLGFVAGPLTYLSGEYWGIVFYQNPKVVAMATHGVIWALLLFYALRIYQLIYAAVEKKILVVAAE